MASASASTTTTTGASLKRKRDSDEIYWQITNKKGEVMRKIEGRHWFPWIHLLRHNYSTTYLQRLLKEMTPYGVRETEEYIVVLYSPTKLIDGNELAYLADRNSDTPTEDLIEDEVGVAQTKNSTKNASTFSKWFNRIFK